MSATHLQTEHFSDSARIVDTRSGKIVLVYEGKSSHRRIEYAYQMILLGWMLNEESKQRGKRMDPKTRPKTMLTATLQNGGDCR